MPRRKVLGWVGLLIVVAAVVVAVVYIVFWPLSDLIAGHDAGAVTGSAHGAALQTARDAARGRLLTFGAGLFAAGALVYTARNTRIARETHDMSVQGQITDRYTKAIEQLGSGQLDVRIGGIYALERIARDSRQDHPTVMEVLATFIREHCREQRLPPGDDEPGPEDPQRRPRPDVQAAARVIGRRIISYDIQPVDLTAVDLLRADLREANLTCVQLSHAQLSFAALTDANLTRANLFHTSLRMANLRQANLTGADLTRARLNEANLTGADLTKANLPKANLTGADLTGADLTGADLTGANLTGALLPPDAAIPEGWARGSDGRLLGGVPAG